MSRSTLILVEVSLTTVATLRSPEPKPRLGKLSTGSSFSSTVSVKDEGPSSSAAPSPASSVLTTTAMSASGSTLSTFSGRPSERSAAGSSRRAGAPDGSEFGTRQM